MKRVHATRTGNIGGGAGVKFAQAAIRSAYLTIFWRCDHAPFSSRTAPERGPGNEPSTVLAENSMSQGSGNADSQRKVWSSRGSGQCRPSRCDSGCVTAHPASWRASASYRPLRAVWAVCAWALRGCARSPDPSALTAAAHRPKRNFQMTTVNQVRQGPRHHLRHHPARRRAVARRHHDPRGEARGRRAARRHGRRHHRGRLPDRLRRRLRGGAARSPSASKNAVICGLARANSKDIDRCAEAVQAAPSAPRIHTFISHLAAAHASTSSSMDAGRRCSSWSIAHGHPRAQPYRRRRMVGRGRARAPSIDFLCRCVETAIKAGATTINIPDTVGYTTPEEYRRPDPDAARARAERRQGDLLHALPQRPRHGGRQFAGRRARPARGRSNAPSTASASAPATPRWKKS